MPIRRVVTGLSPEGRSTFVIDDQTPRSLSWKPGDEPNLAWVWNTESLPSVPHDNSDPTPALVDFFPKPNGSRFMIETFPPGFGVENVEALSQTMFEVMDAGGIRVQMDKSEGGDHATSTIDYGVVVSGQIWLVLDDGVETELNPGDCIVQTGVSHAWQNRGTTPATVAFVIIGANRTAPVDGAPPS